MFTFLTVYISYRTLYDVLLSKREKTFFGNNNNKKKNTKKNIQQYNPQKTVTLLTFLDQFTSSLRLIYNIGIVLPPTTLWGSHIGPECL